MMGESVRWQEDVGSPQETDNETIALFELAEHLGHVGHWRVSLPDHSVSWSKAAYDIHGVAASDYTPEIETVIGFYHPDDRALLRWTLTTASRADVPSTFSLRLMRSDGQLRHIECRGLTMVRPDGVPTAIFGVFIDVTEQQEAKLKLERIAYVDALTGLSNRRQFDEVLEQEWRRAARDRTTLSLILVDIDRFKRFNDLYGHPAGDECLRALAGALASTVRRPADLAARYGGEEFALILPGTGAAGAEEVALEARTAIAGLKISHSGNIACGGVVTASLGVCTACPREDEPPDGWLGLIADTDALLYEAKRTGRNKVVSPGTIGCSGAMPLAANEEDRLAGLAVYERSGAARRTSDLDRIARLAASLTSSPIGAVTLVGRDEVKFVGSHGLNDTVGVPRDVSFCTHTILGDGALVVPDMTRDSRFEANPLVTGDTGIRYYAGAPIVSETSGYRLGTVCVIDMATRAETSLAQRALLADLAKMALALLEETIAPPDGQAGA